MTQPAGAVFRAFASEWQPRIEATLDRLLPAATAAPTRLHDAMRYVMFPGGKRLRPLLALLAARATGGDVERALRPAAALELLHTYSLVHDDLPCMDDDDLRRGRPTCHKVYGEAIAVLVGDALLTSAFGVVAEAGGRAVATLAEAAGSLGMVGGQAGDMLAEAGSRTDLPNGRAGVEWIHDRKTGALIRASLFVGALAGGADDFDAAALTGYGDALGRAFQIADDCLDVTASAATLGKNVGQDAAAAKLTFPAVLGLDASLAEARRQAGLASSFAARVCARLPAGGPLDSAVALLQDAALFAVARTT